MAVEWGTIASLATAGGTLVLAVSTFASVRSANRAARAAQRSLMVGQPPLRDPARLQEPAHKVFWVDNKHVVLPGGTGIAEVGGESDTVYLAMSVRNGERYRSDAVLARLAGTAHQPGAAGPGRVPAAHP